MYYLFNGLLMLLYCLHWFWFYHIMSMAFKLVFYGKVVKDARSESEGSDATDDDEKKNVAARMNGDAPLGANLDASSSSSKPNGVAGVNGISRDALASHHQKHPESSKEK